MAGGGARGFAAPPRGGEPLSDEEEPPRRLRRGEGRRVMLSQAMVPWLLLTAAFLFTLGALGVLIRRNPLVVFMCIELMLNAVNLALVGYSSYLNSEEGQVFAFMVIVVAAAEVVVGLGLLTRVFSIGRELDVDDLDEMKQ